MSRRLQLARCLLALAATFALLAPALGSVHNHDSAISKVCHVCHVAHLPALQAVPAAQVAPPVLVVRHAPATDFFYHTEPHFSLDPTRAPPSVL